MKTLLLSIDETSAGDNLEDSLRAIRGIEEIKFLNNPPLTSFEWARPGIPATDEQLEISALEAEASTVFFSIEDIKAELKVKYSIRG